MGGFFFFLVCFSVGRDGNETLGHWGSVNIKKQRNGDIKNQRRSVLHEDKVGQAEGVNRL